MSKSANPRKVDSNQLTLLFGKFKKIGIHLNSAVENELLQQLAQSGPKGSLNAHHTTNPLLALIRDFTGSDWQPYLRSNTWIHKEVARVLSAVLVQQTEHLYQFATYSNNEGSLKRNLNEVSIVARRYLLWLAGQGEDEAVTSPHVSDFAGWFPREDTPIGSRQYDATDNASWLKFQDRLSNLLSHKYLNSKDNEDRKPRLGLGSDEEENEDNTLDFEEPDGTDPDEISKEQKDKARNLHAYHRDRETPLNPTGYQQFKKEAVCTSILSAHSYNEAIGLKLLQYLCRSIDTGSAEIDENPGFFLVAMLSIEFGIPPPDVLHLGLEHGVSSFGSITSRMLFLNLGSSFYKSGARAFDRDCIVLPLSREAWTLLKKALKKPSENYVKNINVKRKKRSISVQCAPTTAIGVDDDMNVPACVPQSVEALGLKRRVTDYSKLLEKGMEILRPDSPIVTSLRTPKTIGDLVGLQPKAFRVLWRKFVREKMPGFATYSSHLHQVWESVALLDAKIPRPLAGLLRTKPLRGTHAECSYLSVPHNELVDASIRIRNALREKAGLGPAQLAQAPKERYNLHSARGTRSPTLEEYWAKTEQLLDTTHEFNEVVACVVRFMRGLGIRYSTIHYQPSYYVVQLPEPSFEILDKPVNASDRARYLPITEAICELVIACADQFGESTDLLYLEGNELVPFNKIRDRTKVEVILDDGGSARQVGRTAFFSALLRQGCGEAIRNFLMGHGSSIFQPYSEHGLLSVSDWIRQARAPVEKIYTKCRVNEIATKLAAKVRSFPLPAIYPNRSTEPPTLPRHGVSYYGENLDAGSISPPLPIEHALLHQIRSKLDICKIEATPQALACQLAFVHGIPASMLTRLASYIRFRDFISFGGWIYLLMPMEHQDKGGLSRYPIKICQEDKTSPTLQILKKLWKRLKQLNKGVSDTNLIERAVLIKTAVTSAHNKRRESRGKETASYYSFHAPSPLDKETFAKSLRRLLKEREVRTSLQNEHLWNLASRLSEIVCAWQHPSVVFGALRAHSKRGLNYYCVQDVFRFMDYDAAEPSVYVSQTPLAAEKQIPRLTDDALLACIKKLRQLPQNLTRRAKATEVAKILSEMEIYSDYRVLRRLLKESALKLTPDEIYDERVTKGLARESSALPLVSRGQLKSVVRRASLFIRGSELRRPSWNVTKSRHLALRLYLYILANSGLRLTEPTDLKIESTQIVHRSPFIFIKRGKTHSSRRIVALPPGSLTGGLRGVIELAQKQAANIKGTEKLLFLSKRPASDGTAINRALSTASDERISTHDLRHHIAVFSVQAIITNQLSQGNYHTAMTTLARRLGHGSVSVTEYSYLGTAIAALKLPTDLDAPQVHTFGSLTDVKMKCVHGSLTAYQFGTLAIRVASGELAEQQKQLRKIRKLENQLKSLGQSKDFKCDVKFLPRSDYTRGLNSDTELEEVPFKILVNYSKELLPQTAEVIKMAIRLRRNINVYLDERSSNYLIPWVSLFIQGTSTRLKSSV